MSVEAMAWAYSIMLPPCPKSVLVALANRADEDGYCWPGIDDLERRTGWKRRAVQTAIKDLQARHLLTVSPQFSEQTGVQKSNLYRLALLTSQSPTGRGEGAPDAPYRAGPAPSQGAPPAPLRVHQVRGEGAPPAPESSSEQSFEQSKELSVGLTPDAKRLWVLAEGLLGFLNRKTGKHYPARKPNKDPTVSLKAVHALLRQGYTEEQVRKVIANRLLKWGDDQKMREYLRPDTLFRPSKFEQYLGELGVTHAMPNL